MTPAPIVAVRHPRALQEFGHSPETRSSIADAAGKKQK
jgi:hypothetical protein